MDAAAQLEADPGAMDVWYHTFISLIAKRMTCRMEIESSLCTLSCKSASPDRQIKSLLFL
eukprot:scaffold6789_cov206-Skeletonema_marinoi.AAC.13